MECSGSRGQSELILAGSAPRALIGIHANREAVWVFVSFTHWTVDPVALGSALKPAGRGVYVPRKRSSGLRLNP
jgi:hypothetical protein